MRGRRQHRVPHRPALRGAVVFQQQFRHGIFTHPADHLAVVDYRQRADAVLLQLDRAPSPGYPCVRAARGEKAISPPPAAAVPPEQQAIAIVVENEKA